jgi:hypothetical protein
MGGPPVRVAHFVLNNIKEMNASDKEPQAKNNKQIRDPWNQRTAQVVLLYNLFYAQPF